MVPSKLNKHKTNQHIASVPVPVTHFRGLKIRKGLRSDSYSQVVQSCRNTIKENIVRHSNQFTPNNTLNPDYSVVREINILEGIISTRGAAKLSFQVQFF